MKPIKLFFLLLMMYVCAITVQCSDNIQNCIPWLKEHPLVLRIILCGVTIGLNISSREDK